MKIGLIFGCCPKPFLPEFKNIQLNSIQSWLRLDITKRVLVFGEEDGIQESLFSLPSVEFHKVQKNKFGTPIVSDIFKQLQQQTKIEQEKDTSIRWYACYVNCDIILCSNFINTLKAFDAAHRFQKDFLLIGDRTDLDFQDAIDFKDEWETSILKKVSKEGRSHGKSGIDYFIFSSTTYPFVFPFALGKLFWDRWLVGNAFRRGSDVMTVDVSNTVTVIHQNSPWFQSGKVVSHFPSLYESEESKMNHEFDYYEKDILSGTRFETEHSDNNILFTKKDHIPNEFE